MKKLIPLLLLFGAFVFSGHTTASTQKAQASVSKPLKIELYYFHFTRRCATCQAVESETQAAIAKLYPEQVKKGLISFKSVNLDEKTSESLAKKCKVEGQALLVMSGNKRVDITDQAFMYAKSNPEKFKAELKKAIDSLF